MGKRKVEDLPRLRGRSKHRVDYRHIIEWLIRKARRVLKATGIKDLFPTSRFRMAYDVLQETTPSRSSKEYLKILKLAAEEGEVQVDDALRETVGGDKEAGGSRWNRSASCWPSWIPLRPVTMWKCAGGPGQLRPVFVEVRQ